MKLGGAERDANFGLSARLVNLRRRRQCEGITACLLGWLILLGDEQLGYRNIMT
jgi:hypothetical protein